MDIFGKKQQRYDLCEHFIRRVSRCDNLLELFSLHRQIWDSGIRNANIGPNEFGMFRTEDISRMKPEEVFLGNIFGLSTLPLPQWIGTPEEPIISMELSRIRTCAGSRRPPEASAMALQMLSRQSPLS